METAAGTYATLAAGISATACPLYTAAPMLRDHAVCRAGNALRPCALLSRLFNIPLSRTRPLLRSHRAAAAFSSCAVRPRSNHGPRDTDLVTPSSLDVTLEAHRRANRDPVPRPFAWRRITAISRFNGQAKPKASQKTGGETELQEPIKDPRPIPPPEYCGKYQRPLFNRDNARDESLPWFIPSLRSSSSPVDRLRAELDAFVRYIEPTPAERGARDYAILAANNVWDNVSAQKKSLRDFRLEIFGSEKTGLATATSDIDFRMYHVKAPQESEAEKAPRYFRRVEANKALKKLHSSLERDRNWREASLLHARYPLISVQHRNTGLDIQIVSCNDTSHAQAVMARYRKDLPALYPLYMILKHTLDIRGFCDVYRGGIGSYALFYMIAAGMKLGSPAPHDDHVAQLLTVLDFWSDFDATNNWISLEPLSILPKVDAPKEPSVTRRVGTVQQDQPYLMCLRDPADDTNDLGRKTFQWRHLQETLKTLNKGLRQRLQSGDGSLLLRPFVGTDYRLLREKRDYLVAAYQRHLKFNGGNPKHRTSGSDASHKKPGSDASKEKPELDASNAKSGSRASNAKSGSGASNEKSGSAASGRTVSDIILPQPEAARTSLAVISPAEISRAVILPWVD